MNIRRQILLPFLSIFSTIAAIIPEDAQASDDNFYCYSSTTQSLCFRTFPTCYNHRFNHQANTRTPVTMCVPRIHAVCFRSSDADSGALDSEEMCYSNFPQCEHGRRTLMDSIRTNNTYSSVGACHNE